MGFMTMTITMMMALTKELPPSGESRNNLSPPPPGVAKSAEGQDWPTWLQYSSGEPAGCLF